MDKKSIDTIIKHIKTREPVECIYFDVVKILNACDMAEYGKLCCRRIKDAGLIDDMNVVLCITGDIKVNLQGIFICSDILKGYMKNDEFTELVRYCRSEQEVIDAENEYLYALKNITKDNSPRIRERLLKSGWSNDDINTYDLLAKEELKARRVKNLMRNKLNKILYKWCNIFLMYLYACFKQA